MSDRVVCIFYLPVDGAPWAKYTHRKLSSQEYGIPCSLTEFTSQKTVRMSLICVNVFFITPHFIEQRYWELIPQINKDMCIILLTGIKTHEFENAARSNNCKHVLKWLIHEIDGTADSVRDMIVSIIGIYESADVDRTCGERQQKRDSEQTSDDDSESDDGLYNQRMGPACPSEQPVQIDHDLKPDEKSSDQDTDDKMCDRELEKERNEREAGNKFDLLELEKKIQNRRQQDGCDAQNPDRENSVQKPEGVHAVQEFERTGDDRAREKEGEREPEKQLDDQEPDAQYDDQTSEQHSSVIKSEQEEDDAIYDKPPLTKRQVNCLFDVFTKEDAMYMVLERRADSDLKVEIEGKTLLPIAMDYVVYQVPKYTGRRPTTITVSQNSVVIGTHDVQHTDSFDTQVNDAQSRLSAISKKSQVSVATNTDHQTEPVATDFHMEEEPHTYFTSGTTSSDLISGTHQIDLRSGTPQNNSTSGTPQNDSQSETNRGNTIYMDVCDIVIEDDTQHANQHLSKLDQIQQLLKDEKDPINLLCQCLQIENHVRENNLRRLDEKLASLVGNMKHLSVPEKHNSNKGRDEKHDSGVSGVGTISPPGIETEYVDMTCTQKHIDKYNSAGSATGGQCQYSNQTEAPTSKSKHKEDVNNMSLSISQSKHAVQRSWAQKMFKNTKKTKESKSDKKKEKCLPESPGFSRSSGSSKEEECVYAEPSEVLMRDPKRKKQKKHGKRKMSDFLQKTRARQSARIEHALIDPNLSPPKLPERNPPRINARAGQSH